MSLRRTGVTPVSRCAVAFVVGIAFGVPLSVDRVSSAPPATPARGGPKLLVLPDERGQSWYRVHRELLVRGLPDTTPGPFSARGARAFRRGDAVAVPVRRETALRIVEPADGTLVDRHEPAVGGGGVRVAWTSGTGLRYHRISLVDLTLGTRVGEDEVVSAGAFGTTIDGARLRYGHSYQVTVSAVGEWGVQSDSVRVTARVLPQLTDPGDLRQDQDGVEWTGCTPALLAARDRFESAARALGWRIQYTSAYRSLRFQEHLYLIVTNLSDPALPEAARRTLLAERDRHALSQTVAPPTTRDSHVSGIAFDAAVVDAAGRALNTLTWRDPRVEALANRAGLRMLPPGLADSVHFQL